MRFLGWRSLALVVLVVVGASCDGDKFADEGNLPQEALVVMPGAVVVNSSFGHSVECAVDGVTGRDVYDFYLSELSDKGWEFHADGSGVRQSEPGQCRSGTEAPYCGRFEPIVDVGGGYYYVLNLDLFTKVDDSGPHVGIAHIDDEIDGYRVSTALRLAPAE